jgi:hypothetical protein
VFVNPQTIVKPADPVAMESMPGEPRARSIGVQFGGMIGLRRQSDRAKFGTPQKTIVCRGLPHKVYWVLADS